MLAMNSNNEALFASLVAMFPGHVYWKDLNGVYQGCNDNAAKYVGLNSRNEIVGKTDYDLPVWRGQAM